VVGVRRKFGGGERGRGEDDLATAKRGGGRGKTPTVGGNGFGSSDRLPEPVRYKKERAPRFGKGGTMKKRSGTTTKEGRTKDWIYSQSPEEGGTYRNRAKDTIAKERKERGLPRERGKRAKALFQERNRLPARRQQTGLAEPESETSKEENRGMRRGPKAKSSYS